jgi:predicted molibdopterin-dependent oxidoreductase YjgC
MTERDLSFYEPFEKLVEITIEGKIFAVPENNILLRCVQYIVDEGVVPGRFCWNDECGNCEMSLRASGESQTSRVRGCQTQVENGMNLTELTPELKYWLVSKLK